MVASRDSNSIGLTSNSSHPVAIAFSRSLSSANADMPMIGMSRVCGSFLRSRTGSHQDYVRALGQCQLAALRAVLSRENLEIANPLKAHLEHVEVIVVVFDVEHFGHSVPAISAVIRDRAGAAPTAGRAERNVMEYSAEVAPITLA